MSEATTTPRRLQPPATTRIWLLTVLLGGAAAFAILVHDGLVDEMPVLAAVVLGGITLLAGGRLVQMWRRGQASTSDLVRMGAATALLYAAGATGAAHAPLVVGVGGVLGCVLRVATERARLQRPDPPTGHEARP